ncbi:UNVERIFIED_CONTAM: nuoM, partial [Trichonephila clavipes]
ELYAVGIALTGLVLGIILFAFAYGSVKKLANTSFGAGVAHIWRSAFGFDALYDLVFVKPYLLLARILGRDPVDGLWLMIPTVVKGGHKFTSWRQTGSLLPFIAGFICWIIAKAGANVTRWIALIGMTITLVLSLMLWQQGNFQFEPQGATPEWAAEFMVQWIPTFGISIHLAADGLSMLMVALTALLGILAVGCSWSEIQKNEGFFFLNLLWSLGGVIGVFLAIDMFLFFFFWEMMLVPIYFLIALWGHKGSNGRSRVYAATKFFIYTQVSGLIMLVGILALVLVNYTQQLQVSPETARITFNYMELLGTQIPHGLDYALMLCFFIGFAVKLPVFPFHGWLPDAHAQAPTAGSVDLAGILIKTAAYGLLRFVIPFFPEASAEFANIAIILGLFGVFYGAVLAYQQTDMKRLLAYTSISHMGFILLAIYAGNIVSFQGVMIMMLAHGLSSAALFIMCGQVYERMHTRDMRLM